MSETAVATPDIRPKLSEDHAEAVFLPDDDFRTFFVKERRRFHIMFCIGILSIIMSSFATGVCGSIYIAKTLSNAMPGKHGLLVASQEHVPVRVQQHMDSLPLSVLNDLPLAQIEKMHSVQLQWGADGSGTERKYYFTVESLFRDVAMNETVLHLSSAHRLHVYDTEALLISDQYEILGILKFDLTAEEKAADAVEDKDNRRRLAPMYPNYRPGASEFFEHYCRYGCGNMAVTFPYYYRPFFGYGFPLVGTEASFPGGYGGNPVSQLAAAGVIGGDPNAQINSALAAAGGI